MKTIKVQAEISNDGKLRIDVPCELPPGPVDVLLEVEPRQGRRPVRPNWDELYGLGKEVWQGIDPERYVQDLREDRDTPG
jgi:hypothetical protein